MNPFTCFYNTSLTLPLSARFPRMIGQTNGRGNRAQNAQEARTRDRGADSKCFQVLFGISDNDGEHKEG